MNNEYEIRRALHEISGIEIISDSDDLLIDLGLDSLATSELIAKLESISGRRIQANDLLDVNTVGELVSLFKAQA
jgi:acyl carrier protein